jgi:hypothetical protein
MASLSGERILLRRLPFSGREAASPHALAYPRGHRVRASGGNKDFYTAIMTDDDLRNFQTGHRRYGQTQRLYINAGSIAGSG